MGSQASIQIRLVLYRRVMRALHAYNFMQSGRLMLDVEQAQTVLEQPDFAFCIFSNMRHVSFPCSSLIGLCCRCTCKAESV